jgi:hypothetical protein
MNDRENFLRAATFRSPEWIPCSVDGLYDPAGGLMLMAYFSGDTPLRNIEAVCTAFEDFCFGRK